MEESDPALNQFELHKGDFFMPNANRSKFVLNDFFILSDKEELDKEKLEQSLLQNGEAIESTQALVSVKILTVLSVIL